MRKLICTCCLLLASSLSVEAKSISRILAETGLTSEDFDLMGQYAASLYDRGTPQKGKTATWSNAESGASGQVLLQEVKNNCVRLRHEATPGGKAKPVLIYTRRCKNAEGIWVLQP